MADLSGTHCIPLEFAYLLSSLLPRGKGAVPRLIGRLARPWIHHYLVTRHGAKLPIVPEALDVFVSMKGQDNSWDYWVFRALNRAVRRGNIVYDIGANVGYLSVELATHRQRDNITVIAFEPQRRLARNIRLAARLNDLDNLFVKECVVGSEMGDVSFSEMRHSVHGTAVSGVENAITQYTVPQISIDDSVSDGRLPPPDVIKLDIEGYEYEALSGASQTLTKHKPIVIFEISSMTEVAGRTPADYARLFRECGSYRFFTLDHRSIDLNTSLKRDGHLDVLALPAGRDMH
jgi:FkbM family methyltransferase